MSDTFEVTVTRAAAGDGDLTTHAEHCAVDPRLRAALGLAVGDQVRIVRDAHHYGLYTVSQSPRGRALNVVRMGLDGRTRLGITDEFAAVVDRRVTNSTLSDCEAEAAGEFVERLDDDGVARGLIAIAPHGGDIERRTDDEAERVGDVLKSCGASAWRCKGWKDTGAHDAWHITASDISPRSFPRLGSVIDRGFTHAVAFHGMTAAGVLIGGTAPLALKRTVRDAIRRAVAGSGIAVRIARKSDEFGGDDPGNIVNRLARAGGIQIEQSAAARDRFWPEIADAVAGVYAAELTCVY